MTTQTKRVGLVGYGHIGEVIHSMIEDAENGMEVVFVHDADASRLEALPSELALKDLGDFASRRADLIVEMAHPDVSRKWGRKFLQEADYMPISVTALADRELEEELRTTALASGTRVYVPHGGVVGMDALLENRQVWTDVHVTMKKPPKNVDCAAAGVDPDTITGETVLYEGPVRQICPRFPRNVNTLATIAYAGLGFDRTRATLVVNPDWSTATVAIDAKGPGVELHVERVESITGVTGASTPASIYNSIQMIGSSGPGVHLR